MGSLVNFSLPSCYVFEFAFHACMYRSCVHVVCIENVEYLMQWDVVVTIPNFTGPYVFFSFDECIFCTVCGRTRFMPYFYY